MEESKFYIPTIEEFHIGFEYEEKSSGLWTPQIYNECSPVINKKVFNEYNNQEDTIIGYIRCEIIRVKYLDREDIESLGWEDWEPMGMSCFRYNLEDKDNEFQLYYQFDNNWCQIYNWDSQYVFQGYIKNKSELKKLMKQLGINENP